MSEEKQQDRPRTAAFPFRAGNSEVEPDGQKQGSGNTDRQGRESGQVGGRASIFTGCVQCGERDVFDEERFKAVKEEARVSEVRVSHKGYSHD